MQVILFGLKNQQIRLDVADCLEIIKKNPVNDLLKFQKHQVIVSVVNIVRDIKSVTKNTIGLSQDIQDAIAQQDVKAILNKVPDEPWEDQRLSTLLELLKALLVHCPLFINTKVQQNMQVILFGLKSQQIRLDVADCLEIIKKNHVNDLLKFQKHQVIASVVNIVRDIKSVTKNTIGLSQDIQDAIAQQDVKAILNKVTDEPWEDQRLSTLLELLKALLVHYPSILTDSFCTCITNILTQISQQNDLLLDLSKVLSNDEGIQNQFIRQQTSKVIVSVVNIVRDIKSVTKNTIGLPQDIQDAIAQQDVKAILNKVPDEPWEDQRLSTLLELLKALLVHCPLFINTKVQQNMQVILFGLKNQQIRLDVADCLEIIKKNPVNDLLKFQKHQVIVSVVNIVRDIKSVTKNTIGLSQDIQDAIAQQDVKAILNKVTDEPWEDQRLSTLLELLKALLVHCPLFINTKVQQNMQVILFGLKSQQIRLDVADCLEIIKKNHVNDLLKFQKHQVIASVVNIVRDIKSVTKNTIGLSQDIQDAIAQQDVKAILNKVTDEPWEDQRLSTLLELLKALLVHYPSILTDSFCTCITNILTQISQQNDLLLDLSKVLSNDEGIQNQFIRQQTSEVIASVVNIVRDIKSVTKNTIGLPQDIQDAIAQQDVKAILNKVPDEPWKDQRLSTLLELLKALLVHYPSILTDSFCTCITNILTQISQQNDLLLDLSKVLSNDEGIQNQFIRQQTSEVIASVVNIVRDIKSVTKNTIGLPQDIQDAIAQQDVKAILNKVPDEPWKDQRLSTLLELLKALLVHYPSILTDSFCTCITNILTQISQQNDLLLDLSKVLSNDEGIQNQFIRQQTSKVIVSVVNIVRDIKSVTKNTIGLPQDIQDAIAQQDVKAILNKVPDEPWEDQRLSTLLELLKALLVHCPLFINTKVQQNMQVILFGLKNQQIRLDVADCLEIIKKNPVNDLLKFQKHQVIVSVVNIVRDIKSVTKNTIGLSQDIQDAIAQQDVKAILNKVPDEPWEDQRLSTLLELLKALLVHCPLFINTKVQQNMQVILFGLKNQQIRLDVADCLEIIKKNPVNDLLKFQKHQVIASVVNIVRDIKSVTENTIGLSQDIQDAIAQQDVKAILNKVPDEPWKDQRLSTLLALFITLFDQFPLKTLLSQYQNFNIISYNFQRINNVKFDQYNNMLLLVDEVLFQQNKRRQQVEALTFSKYEQYSKLNNPSQYLNYFMENSPIAGNQREINEVQKYYKQLDFISQDRRLFLFTEELYNLRRMESIFWRNISLRSLHYNKNINKSDNIIKQCIFAGTDMSLFNFIKHNNIQKNILSSSDITSYQHSKIIGLPYPHVQLSKQIFKNQQITLALDDQVSLITKVNSFAQVSIIDYYNIQCPEKALQKQLYLPFISPQLWLVNNNNEDSKKCVCFNNLVKININNSQLYSVNKQNCFSQYFEIIKNSTNISYHVNSNKQNGCTLLTTSSGYINLSQLALFYYEVQQSFDNLLNQLNNKTISKILLSQKKQYLTEINSLLLFLYTITGCDALVCNFTQIFKQQELYSIYFNIFGSRLTQIDSFHLIKSQCKGAKFICLQQPFDDFIFDDINYSQFQKMLLQKGIHYSNLIFQQLKTSQNCQTLICAISIEKQGLFQRFQNIDQKSPDFLITFHGLSSLGDIMSQEGDTYYATFDSGNHSTIGLREKTKNFSKSIIQVGTLFSAINLYESNIETPESMLRIHDKEIKSAMNDLFK
ncbi:hypothetical protein SS50377_27325 [Spironucleus salmonicida]|uniref:Uncharacterized protein n=1 Tax=Spironucleus salmonicida TaxID=348837 RepID=A0A9P8LMV2_9EUKA|nr:hypothetical protein SS50377_27325 [Spironucleus salmonicida]